jgi:phosphoglycolate phosphatase
MPRAELVFDLDGTISDPAPGIARCVNYALRACGFAEVSEADIARFIGPPLDQAFEILVPNPNASALKLLVEKYRERYIEIGYAENALYDGMPEALQRLSGAGVALGVCTAKRADVAEKILEMFGIAGYFSFVDGGDVGVPKARQLARLLGAGCLASAAQMIGDRAVDIEAARANGLGSVGVLWGHGTGDELADAGADILLRHVGELPRLSALMIDADH